MDCRVKLGNDGVRISASSATPPKIIQARPHFSSAQQLDTAFVVF
jgi:hypothetical protein